MNNRETYNQGSGRKGSLIESWYKLVQPKSQSVRTMLAQVQIAEGSPREVARTVLDALGGIQWIPQKGYTPFPEVIELKKGNCLSIAALLCSLLRAAGVMESYVLLFGGGLLGQTLIALPGLQRGAYTEGPYQLTAHAWTVFLGKHRELYAVDPVDRKIRFISSGEQLKKAVGDILPVAAMWGIAFNDEKGKLSRDMHKVYNFLVVS